MNEHIQAWLDPSPVVEIFTSPAFLYFAAGLVLVLLAKPVKGLTTRYHLSEELTKHDNKAVGVATAGYLFAVLTIIRGVMISGGNPYETLWRDLVAVAIWTVISLALLLTSAWINRNFLLNRFEVHKEMITDRNVGTGAVLAGTYIGTAFIISASISGSTGGGFSSTRSSISPSASSASFCSARSISAPAATTCMMRSSATTKGRASLSELPSSHWPS